MGNFVDQNNNNNAFSDFVNMFGVKENKQVEVLKRLQGEVEDVRRKLEYLSGFEGVVENLTDKIYVMSDEVSVYSQMAQALDKVNLFYITNDNRICDVAEQSVIRFLKNDIVNIDLTAIGSILGEDFYIS